MSALVYPVSIAVQGNPAAHGLADLSLVIDRNRPDSELHVILTTGQLVDLHEAISRKLAELPFHLVTDENE